MFKYECVVNLMYNIVYDLVKDDWKKKIGVIKWNELRLYLVIPYYSYTRTGYAVKGLFGIL